MELIFAGAKADSVFFLESACFRYLLICQQKNHPLINTSLAKEILAFSVDEGMCCYEIRIVILAFALRKFRL